MSSSSTQALATQKLLEHIRGTTSPDAPPTAPSPAPLRSGASRRSLFAKERSVVGVDVSEGRISLAQSGFSGDPELRAVYAEAIPEDMTWETPGCAEKVRKALDAFLPDGLEEADIWVRLEEGQNELRHYRIPKVNPKDRDAIARMTANREKPFDESETIFDYRAEEEILDKGVPRQPITAMIASKSAVNRLKRTLADVGVVPAGITSSGIAPQNLFASGWLARPWDHFACADIGEDATRIEIFSGSSIALSRSIKTGLRSLVTALQESHFPQEPASVSSPPPSPYAPEAPRPPADMGFSAPAGPAAPDAPFPLVLQEPAASRPELSLVPPSSGIGTAPAFVVPDESLSYEEGLRLLCETQRDPEEDEALMLRIAQPLGRMARQIERTADHFRNTMNMPSIEGVIVFAPGGCLKLALKTFEKLLGLPCLPLRFDGKATSGAITDLEKNLHSPADSGLLQAIGLSLSSLRYTPNALMTYRDQQVRESQKRITLLSFGVTSLALMFLLAFCGRLYLAYLHGKEVRAELKEQVASWQTRYTADQLKASLAATQKLQSQARQLARRRTAAALMAELSAVAPEAVHLTGMRVTFSNGKPGKAEPRTGQRGGTKATAPEQQESAVAVLTGTVVGDMLQRESRLAEFLSHLEHSPMVLSLLVEKQQTDTDLLTFVATLRLV